MKLERRTDGMMPAGKGGKDEDDEKKRSSLAEMSTTERKRFSH